MLTNTVPTVIPNLCYLTNWLATVYMLSLVSLKDLQDELALCMYYWIVYSVIGCMTQMTR